MIRCCPTKYSFELAIRYSLRVAARFRRSPECAKVDVTLEIDASCVPIAPGTGTPSLSGFLSCEVLGLLQRRMHKIVKIKLVEVAPDYGRTGSIAIVAAQILCNFPSVSSCAPEGAEPRVAARACLVIDVVSAIMLFFNRLDPRPGRDMRIRPSPSLVRPGHSPSE